MLTLYREPAPLGNYERVNIGDVGYIRRGCFHLLFSAAVPLGTRRRGEDVPLAFEQLDVGRITTYQPRIPGCLCTQSARVAGADVQASVTTGRYPVRGLLLSKPHIFQLLPVLSRRELDFHSN
jgi:hypothetical protein